MSKGSKPQIDFTTECEEQTHYSNNKLLTIEEDGENKDEERESSREDEEEESEETLKGISYQIGQDYDLEVLQRECPEVGPIIRFLENGILPQKGRLRRKIEFEKNHYFMKNRILWHKQQTRGVTQTLDRETVQRVIPIALREIILREYHERNLGHCSFFRTFSSISRSYFWDGIFTQIRNFTKGCKKCQAGKDKGRGRCLLKPLGIPAAPHECIHIDIVTGVPPSLSQNRHIFTCIDSFSSWPWLFAIPDMKTTTLVDCLIQVVKEIGIPARIISDSGANVISKVVQSFCDLLGIKKIRTASFSPTSNSKLERYHSTMGGMLRTCCTDILQWDRVLPWLEFSFRGTSTKGVGLSPYEIKYGGSKMRNICDIKILENEPEKEVEPGDYMAELKQHIQQVQRITKLNI